MEHNWLLGMFSRRAPGGGVLARSRSCSRPGSVNPKDGTATPKGDGYELTGHWKFGTGIVHADWVLLSGAHRDRAGRGRRACSSCVPTQVEVRDTWHVDGMVATGSHDIVATAPCYVPERTVSLPRRRRARGQRTRPTSMRLPVLPMLVAHRGDSRARRGAARGRAVPARSSRERVPFGTQQAAEPARAPRRCASPTRSPTCARAETVLRAVARDVTAHARGEPRALAARPDPAAPHDRARRARLPRASCAT